MREDVDGVILIGTAHVSKKSVEEVLATLDEVQPTRICVELDEHRLRALEHPDEWAQRPLTEVIRQGQAGQVLAQVFLASHQQKLAKRTGVRPGQEMLAAVEWAREHDAEIVLADREVGITLRRAWRAMGFRERMRVFWEFLASLVGAEHEVEDVDELLEEETLTHAMEELAGVAPRAKEVLVDERDVVLASNIQHDAAEGHDSSVAVLGAGHLKGVKHHLENGAPEDTTDLETVPKAKVPWGKLLGIGLSVLAVGLLAFITYQGITTGQLEYAGIALGLWFLINGILSALGAGIAGGHPLTIASAFLAAPFTSLSPALAAGWFAGLTEAWLRKPTVGDLQGLQGIEGFRDMRRNGVLRILLVAALANLGSTIGTFIGIGVLVERAAELLNLVPGVLG